MTHISLKFHHITSSHHKSTNLHYSEDFNSDFPPILMEELPPTPQKRKSLNLYLESHPLSAIHELLFYRFLFHKSKSFPIYWIIVFSLQTCYKKYHFHYIFPPNSPLGMSMLYFSPLKVFFSKGSYFVISNLFYIYFLKLWSSSLYNKWSSTITPQPLNPWVSPSQLLTCVTYSKASMFLFILLCQHTMSFSTFSSYENVINHSKCSLETD